MKIKIKRRKKGFKNAYIVVLLMIVLIFISTSYSLWKTTLTINGTVTGVYSEPKLPVEIESLGENSDNVNRFTSNTSLKTLGVDIYKVVDETYEDNVITTTIQQVYKQSTGLNIFRVKPTITLTIPNNTSSVFTNGTVTLIEYNDPNSIFQNITQSISTTITEGSTGTVTISGTLRGNYDVATNTYYKFKITYDVDGVTCVFYYNLIFLAM